MALLTINYYFISEISGNDPVNNLEQTLSAFTENFCGNIS
jgi:hypothetical protein